MGNQKKINDYLMSRSATKSSWKDFVFGTLIFALLLTFLGGILSSPEPSSVSGIWRSGVAIQKQTSSLSVVLGTLGVALAVIGVVTVGKRDAEDIDGLTLARLDEARPVVFLVSLAAAVAIALPSIAKISGTDGEFDENGLGMIVNSEVIAGLVVIVALAVMVSHSLGTYERVGDLAKEAKVSYSLLKWEKLAARNKLTPPTIRSRVSAEFWEGRYKVKGADRLFVLFYRAVVCVAVAGPLWVIGAALFRSQFSNIEAPIPTLIFSVLALSGVDAMAAAFMAIRFSLGGTRVTAILYLLGLFPFCLFLLLLVWVGSGRAVWILGFVGLSYLILLSYDRCAESGKARTTWITRRSTTWGELWRSDAASEVLDELKHIEEEFWPDLTKAEDESLILWPRGA